MINLLHYLVIFLLSAHKLLPTLALQILLRLQPPNLILRSYEGSLVYLQPFCVHRFYRMGVELLLGAVVLGDWPEVFLAVEEACLGVNVLSVVFFNIFSSSS